MPAMRCCELRYLWVALDVRTALEYPDYVNTGRGVDAAGRTHLSALNATATVVLNTARTSMMAALSAEGLVPLRARKFFLGNDSYPLYDKRII